MRGLALRARQKIRGAIVDAMRPVKQRRCRGVPPHREHAVYLLGTLCGYTPMVFRIRQFGVY